MGGSGKPSFKTKVARGGGEENRGRRKKEGARCGHKQHNYFNGRLHCILKALGNFKFIYVLKA